jgi:hypothetical protein
MEKFNYTALGLVVGGAVGALAFALTMQVWWLGLVGVGLVLGAAMESAKGRRKPGQGSR